MGPKKIVEGMQEALRSLRTTNVTRKDIAHFAGVTPALVTYYFPERDTLTEAATAPVVEQLSTLVQNHLARSADRHSILLQIAHDVVDCYLKDIYIVELHVTHRKAAGRGTAADPLQDMIRSITAFFDDWLSNCGCYHYNGRFLNNALLGLCRSVAYNHQGEGGEDSAAYALMIHNILIGALSSFTLDDVNQVRPADAKRKHRLVASPTLTMACAGLAMARKGGPVSMAPLSDAVERLEM